MIIALIKMASGAGGLLEQAPQAVFETELSHTFISIIICSNTGGINYSLLVRQNKIVFSLHFFGTTVKRHM